MPGIQDSKDSLDAIKKLLGFDNPREKARMGKRNAEIALLLNDPTIVNSNVFNDFKSEYEKLADRAKKIDAKSKTSKKDAITIAGDLRLLKKKVRLAAAEKDPTTTTKVEEELVRSLKQKPFYLEKRERVEATLQEIKAMPGTHVEAKAVQDMLDAADSCEPDYEKALARITLYLDLAVGEHEGMQRHLDDAKKTAQKFATTAGGPEFQKVLKKARETVTAYEKVAGVSDGRGIALANGEIAEAVKLLDAPKPDVKAATEKVQKVITALEDKSLKLGNIKDDLDKRVSAITKAVGKVVDYAPVEEGVGLLANHKTARALWENQQFETAKTAWDQLEKDAQTALDKYEPPFKKWEDYNKQIEKKSAVLSPALDNQTLSGPANYVQSLIKQRIGVDMIPLHLFGEACKLVESEKILDSLDELTTLLKDPSNAKFTNPELDYRIQVQKARKTLDDKLEELSAAIKKLDEKGGDTSPFDSTVKLFSDGFVQATSYVQGQQKLDLDKILSVMLRDLKLVTQNVEKAATTDLDSSKADKKKLVAAAEFEKARVKAEAALREVDEYGLADDHKWMKNAPSIVGLRDDYQKMVADAKNAIYPPDGKLEKIATDCVNKQKLIEGDLKLLRERAEEKAASLNRSIDQAEKSNSKYKTLYATLRNEVDDALGLTHSGVVAQIEQGTVALDNIKLPPPQDFEKVTQGLKDVENLLSESDLKDYQPEAQAILKKRLAKELKPRVHQLSPAEAEKEINEFKAEIKKASDRAVQLKDVREDVKKRAISAKTLLDGIKTTSPHLFKSLSSRLEKVKEPAKDAVDQANLELASIEMLIKSAKGSGQAKLEKKAKSDEFEQKRQAATFIGSMKVFTYGVKVDAFNLYNSTPDGIRNKDVYKQIGAVAEKAQTFANTGNYTAANQELIKAVNLAKYFLDNPIDRASASRKELIRLNEEYKAAVSGYLKQLSDLVAALKKAQSDDGSGTVKNIDATGAEKVLQPLFSLFGAEQFDGAVERLAEIPTTLEELQEDRTYKEIALKDVRLSEKALNSNKVLAHVLENTISPVSISAIRASLRGLTGALQAS
jgi:hypothetical protein